MRLFLIAGILATMALSLTAAGLAGTWKGSMETQMGTTGVTITITSGTGLAGRVTLDQFEGTIENAKVDGDKVSFVVNIEPGTIGFEGTAAGDEMKLNVTGTQGNKYSLVCKRQK